MMQVQLTASCTWLPHAPACLMHPPASCTCLPHAPVCLMHLPASCTWPPHAPGPPPLVQVLLCALRQDMEDFPLPHDLHLPEAPSGSSGLEALDESAVPLLQPTCSNATAASPTSLQRTPPPSAPLSADAAHTVASRPYLLCCVRLSPEKEPHRFVELVEELARRGALHRLQLTPLLIGSAKDEYAEVCMCVC